MRRELAHEHAVGHQPLARVREQVLERLAPGRPRHERAARLVVGDLAGQVGDLVLGDVRRVRHDELEPAAQRRRAARRTTSPPRCARAWPRSRRCWRAPRRARRRSRRSPTPRRRGARRRARARSRPSRCRGRRRPRSGSASTSVRCRRRTRRSPRRSRFLERDLHDLLGLRARDQHAPVDHEVEAAERPRAEHVLQRLAADAALDHRPQPRATRARAAARRRSSATRRRA